MVIVAEVTWSSIGSWPRCLIFGSSFVAWEAVWDVLSDTVTLEVAQEVHAILIVIWVIVARAWNTSLMSKLVIIKSLFAWAPCSCLRIFNSGQLIYTIFVDLNSLAICAGTWSISLEVDMKGLLAILWTALHIEFSAFFSDWVHCICILTWSRNIWISALLSLGKVHFLIGLPADTKGVQTRFRVVRSCSRLANFKFGFESICVWRWGLYNQISHISNYLRDLSWAFCGDWKRSPNPKLQPLFLSVLGRL